MIKTVISWLSWQASSVNVRYLILKKMGMKDLHLKHMHNTELCTSQHYEESSCNVSWKSAWLGVFLKCLHTNACDTRNKQEELVYICTATISPIWLRSGVACATVVWQEIDRGCSRRTVQVWQAGTVRREHCCLCERADGMHEAVGADYEPLRAYRPGLESRLMLATLWRVSATYHLIKEKQ